jgi:hypothetical protein
LVLRMMSALGPRLGEHRPSARQRHAARQHVAARLPEAARLARSRPTRSPSDLWFHPRSIWSSTPRMSSRRNRSWSSANGVSPGSVGSRISSSAMRLRPIRRARTVVVR